MNGLFAAMLATMGCLPLFLDGFETHWCEHKNALCCFAVVFVSMLCKGENKPREPLFKPDPKPCADAGFFVKDAYQQIGRLLLAIKAYK